MEKELKNWRLLSSGETRITSLDLADLSVPYSASHTLWRHRKNPPSTPSSFQIKASRSWGWNNLAVASRALEVSAGDTFCCCRRLSAARCNVTVSDTSTTPNTNDEEEPGLF